MHVQNLMIESGHLPRSIFIHVDPNSSAPSISETNTQIAELQESFPQKTFPADLGILLTSEHGILSLVINPWMLSRGRSINDEIGKRADEGRTDDGPKEVEFDCFVVDMLLEFLMVCLQMHFCSRAQLAS